MARTTLPPDDEPATDDYVIERAERPALPILTQIIRLFRALMVIVLVAASLALFWLVGTMIGLF